MHLSLEFSQSSFRLALGTILMLFFHGTARAAHGRLPKRPNGSDCKSDASCFGGSNPSPATTRWFQ